jgi:hypothetical protein
MSCRLYSVLAVKDYENILTLKKCFPICPDLINNAIMLG